MDVFFEVALAVALAFLSVACTLFFDHYLWPRIQEKRRSRALAGGGVTPRSPKSVLDAQPLESSRPFDGLWDGVFVFLSLIVGVFAGVRFGWKAVVFVAVILSVVVIWMWRRPQSRNTESVCRGHPTSRPKSTLIAC